MISTRHTLDDARIVHKEAMSLIKTGYDVNFILPCNDRYEYMHKDGSIIAVGKAPNGEVLYKGIKVFGYPKRKGLIGKLKMYFEFCKLAADLKADVYHAHEPDLSLLIAIRTKKILAKLGIQSYVVHDMHEYPPGAPADNSPKFFKLPILLINILWDKLLIKWVDHVFTANTIVRGYVLCLSNRMKVDVLYNAPSLKLFPQLKRKSWFVKGEKLLLCHEGSLPFNRGLKELVEAVYYLRDRVSLRIVGDVFGDERRWLHQEIENKKLYDTITITGWLPYEKVSKAINDCHVGLILFRDCINNRLAGPPNKLFNYMNAGLPVLSVDFPEMRQIIIEENCGRLIENESVIAIIDAIELILSNSKSLNMMSKNGQRAVRERYSWNIMERKLLFSYERLLKINH